MGAWQLGISSGTPIDPSGKIGSLDAFSRLRVSEPFSIFDSKQVYDSNPLFFETFLAGAGASTYVQNKAATELTTTVAAGDRAVRQTKRYFNYQSGKSHLLLATFNFQGLEPNVTKRVGYFDDNNGVFFEAVGATINLVIRSNVSGAPVETRIPQGSWNIDNFDGTGPSQVVFDPTKTQIFICDFQWLGVGEVRVGTVIDGVNFYAHQFQHANNLDVVYMQTPNLPVRWEIETTGVAANPAQLDAICCSVMSEGGIEQSGIIRSADNGVTTRIIGATLTPLISIRLKASHNRQTVIPTGLSMVATTGANLRWAVLLNPTIVTPPAAVWASVSDAIEADVARTGAVTGGTQIASGYMSNNVDLANAALSSQLVLASDFAGVADELVLCAHKIGGGTETVAGGLSWVEVQ